MQAHPAHRIGRRFPHDRGKDAVKVKPRQCCDIRQGVERQIAGWVVVDVIENAREASFVMRTFFAIIGHGAISFRLLLLT